MAVNKKSNLLECIFISKKSLEISLNLTSQIKQLSLTHFVLIVTEPNLEARSFYSEYRGILAQALKANVKSTDDKAKEEARVSAKKNTKATDDHDDDDLELGPIPCVWFSIDIPNTKEVSNSWLSTLPRDDLHEFVHVVIKN